jgi:prepilin-type N-terminal cleavage/methylation domain-containing protein
MGRTRSGFTFIEILIVLMLLTIVGVTFVPQLRAASDDARRSAVAEDLAMLRRQIKGFHDDHNRFPAHGLATQSTFVGHLTKKTSHACDVSDTGRFGPYLIGDVPVNAFTQQNAVLIVPGELKPHQYAGHGEHGWAYSSSTGEIRANLSPNVVDKKSVSVNRY